MSSLFFPVPTQPKTEVILPAPDTTLHAPHAASGVKKVEVICSSNERRAYDKLSVFFVHPLFDGKTPWPLQTNIVCYHDNEPFSTIPIPCPESYDSTTNQYTCYGMFCSPHCVKGYIEERYSTQPGLRMIWLKKMMVEVFGYVEDIIAPPSVDLLKKRGGMMTIEQWRAYPAQGYKIVTHKMPFLTCHLAFELIEKKSHDVISQEEDKRYHNEAKRKLKKAQILEAKPNTTNTNTTNTMTNTTDSVINSEPSSIPNALQPLLPPGTTFADGSSLKGWSVQNLRKPSVPLDAGETTTSSTQPIGPSALQQYLDMKASNPTLRIDEISSNAPAPTGKRRGRPPVKKEAAKATVPPPPVKVAPVATTSTTTSLGTAKTARGSLAFFLKPDKSDKKPG